MNGFQTGIDEWLISQTIEREFGLRSTNIAVKRSREVEPIGKVLARNFQLGRLLAALCELGKSIVRSIAHRQIPPSSIVINRLQHGRWQRAINQCRDSSHLAPAAQRFAGERINDRGKK
ncbi:hypothetical protein K227x_34690 [Rubripirellula lacrimiformis]|uniref:Transposase DDE domain-containing protein n=1 Tax=Rubripirellula lacrimiformis TaxID=1930273 RepID=A0A517ND73_9BACT|nr:hypothetical protein [Rubripirellula lacrimiformis]QDT05071.1 hypothetical protein K227x_34690 [Rubripirellula lacrimiformis]